MQPHNPCAVVFALVECCAPRRATPRWLRHLPLRETLLLQSSFGFMLESLRVNHLSLQTANESKRRFIRYIFHEGSFPLHITRGQAVGWSRRRRRLS
jgi:hypothetical protein